jgi:hypothetical protein
MVTGTVKHSLKLLQFGGKGKFFTVLSAGKPLIDLSIAEKLATALLMI